MPHPNHGRSDVPHCKGAKSRYNTGGYSSKGGPQAVCQPMFMAAMHVGIGSSVFNDLPMIRFAPALSATARCGGSSNQPGSSSRAPAGISPTTSAPATAVPARPATARASQATARPRLVPAAAQRPAAQRLPLINVTAVMYSTRHQFDRSASLARYAAARPGCTCRSGCRRRGTPLWHACRAARIAAARSGRLWYVRQIGCSNAA